MLVEGNYVLCRGAESHITEVRRYSVGYLKNNNGKGEPSLPYKFVQFIPISKDWMIKLGGEKVDEDIYLVAESEEYQYARFDIILKNGKILLKSRYQEDKDAITIPHIEYVHQVQNLYELLSGKKLRKKSRTIKKENEPDYKNILNSKT